MNRILVWLCIVLAGALTMLSVAHKKAVAEKKRFESNQNALMSDVQYYMTKDSLSAASVLQLTLTKNEIEKHRQDLVDEVKALNLKLKHIQSISSIASESNYEIKIIYKDSIRISDKIDTIQCAKFNDAYISVDICDINNYAHVSIYTRDTLKTFVNIVPKRFLGFLWKCGIKEVRQNVVNRNPYSHIIFNEYIDIKN